MTTRGTDLIRKYGKVIGVYEGTAPTLLVTDLDLLRNILIKDSQVFINRRSMEGIGGPFEHALIALKDGEWKNVRSIVSPTFSTAKLKAMYALLNETSDTYSDRLLEYADKQELFNANELNGQYTLGTISSCLFGIETNSLRNENATLIKHLKKLFTVDFKNIFLYIFLISPRFARYLGGKGYSIFPSDAISYVSNIVNDVISRRRQHLERRNDFIQMMIAHEEAVKDEEDMAEQTETKEPQQQQQQQWGTFKKDEITYEKLNQLSYLDMAINETLRMYPPFIRLNRVVSYDYQLDDYHVPKGSFINIPIYSIHHNPEYCRGPEKFIPERFLPDEKAKRLPMTFLPFGDGPRNCIGMRFALLESKLAITKALRVVELQKCEKTEVPLQLGKLNILNAKNGIWVRAVRRSK
ncbi:unnamed protein product [Rotaria socialis]|nr:unnamed protein product [Rotaria socialis]